jgi:ribosomal protein L12E/L44/L45/RPP1/RPP2
MNDIFRQSLVAEMQAGMQATGGQPAPAPAATQQAQDDLSESEDEEEDEFDDDEDMYWSHWWEKVTLLGAGIHCE